MDGASSLFVDAGVARRRVILGEFPVLINEALTFMFDSVQQGMKLPVRVVVPQEGAIHTDWGPALLKGAPHPNAARVLMNYYLGQKMQQSFARLGLLPVTTESLPDIDPVIAEAQKSKLLGTTDPTRMNQMLDLAKQIYR